MLDENRVKPTSIEVDSRGVLDVGAGVLAMAVWPAGDHTDAPWIGPGGAEVTESLGLDLLALLERERVTGKAGEVAALPVLAEGRGAGSVDGDVDVTRILLVGLGDGSVTAHRKAGAALARAARGSDRVASAVTASSDDACVRAFIEGAVLATFRFDAYRSKPIDPGGAPAASLVLAGGGHDAAAARRAETVARAAWLARELVHTPPNVKDPGWLAERAVEIGRERGLDVHVRDEKKLAAEGFGGLIGVGMGSARPPRLVAMRYEPAGSADAAPHIVLVGKGITFDSGGLSLKQRESMTVMKTDMSGAAVVLAVLCAAAELEVPVRITGLLALAENMPGAAAQRPSDVITQYDGTTVEVLNTDAEGRLVLADAIGYAAAELEPDAIVDVATLTGAATVALGRTRAALYANDDALADSITSAGEAAGERMWRMPLVDEYRSGLESQIADIAHIDTKKFNGASIMAALFLERFAADVPWAHLDIAGAGRADRDSVEVVKGGTAFGVRALLTWLESYPSGTVEG